MAVYDALNLYLDVVVFANYSLQPSLQVLARMLDFARGVSKLVWFHLFILILSSNDFLLLWLLYLFTYFKVSCKINIRKVLFTNINNQLQ